MAGAPRRRGRVDLLADPHPVLSGVLEVGPVDPHALPLRIDLLLVDPKLFDTLLVEGPNPVLGPLVLSGALTDRTIRVERRRRIRVWSDMGFSGSG